MTPVEEKAQEQQVAFPDLPKDENEKKTERVQAGKYIFILGENEEADKELRHLIRIVKSESSHW
jgi:hypothetical protein